ncbi:MAG: hypothetical protein H6Q89_526 [Myxococcaceae bacterium]|nr:hypothetical protein [Myxococcaceae bacterium]
MRLAQVVVLMVCVSGAARAASFESRGAQPSKIHLIELASYHGSAPVPRPPVPLPPSPAAPIRAATSGSLVLLGLGLTGAGLVLGGAGFAVLYVCREGTTCFNNTTTTVGWVLAAPGIIPLVVGVAILYFGTGGGRRAELTPTEKAGQWAFSAMPLSGGGMLSGSVRF